MSKLAARRVFSLIAFAVALLGVESSGRAERLPIKTYTTADGLVSNRISRIVRDSRGYLWFCTERGLSRFDGYSFVNYTTEQGLPDNEVNDLLETRSGDYWIATGDGLCRLTQTGSSSSGRRWPATNSSSFIVYKPTEGRRASSIKSLYEDSFGTVWCGTWRGLFRIDQAGTTVSFRPENLAMPDGDPESHVIRNMVEDLQGCLWLATDSGLYRRFPDGRAERFTGKNGLTSERLMGLVRDHRGRLWVGDRGGGVCRLVPDPTVNGIIVDQRFSRRDGLDCLEVASLFESSDGRIWIGTDCGLSEVIQPSEQNAVIRRYLNAGDLTDPRVWSLAEDSYGNLWIGSADGAIRVVRGGFSTFTEADGLGGREIVGLFESRAGELCVQSRSRIQSFFSRFDGERFLPVELNRPRDEPREWFIGPQDHTGSWWLTTSEHVLRFPATAGIDGLSRLRPEVFYAGEQPTVYEDNSGHLDIARGPEGNDSMGAALGYCPRVRRSAGPAGRR